MDGWLDGADKVASVVGGVIVLVGAVIGLRRWRRIRREAEADGELKAMRAAIAKSSPVSDRARAVIANRGRHWTQRSLSYSPAVRLAVAAAVVLLVLVLVEEWVR
ncbi:hypothetical protein [Paractinoplanes atraurantiacus]|uniref:Uncharacterized protein n=1 Tax=Paractinoplanes atraurantiacus TaxID=1036182 RepID=A0A285I4R2_9ACTN|nr:hypothetical protein [Actinoplanes atraurantiacus]SNY42056.1 hypothetical protein SAMN05421748_106238 [Actinoplanes atraurantiacus]